MAIPGWGATITPPAPASIAVALRRAMLSSPAAETPTTTGTRPLTRLITWLAKLCASSPAILGASPMMPRIVMPLTPVSR